jgi:pyridinium-3,5-bisthiocarboxylic acid mononucleotide nickel chelatase
VQVVIGHRTVGEHDDGTPVTLLEANVDDVTGEVLAHAVSTLLAPVPTTPGSPPS